MTTTTTERYAQQLVRDMLRNDPQTPDVHEWYRLPAYEGYLAGCSCDWTSPVRPTFGAMLRDVSDHLAAVHAPASAAA